MENKNIVLINKIRKNGKQEVLGFNDACYLEQCPDLANYTIIDITHTAKNDSLAKVLSSQVLGPCVASDGKEFACFENLWQYSKVYDGVQIVDKNASPIQYYFLVKNGKPTEEYFKRREQGAQLTHVRKPEKVPSKGAWQFYIQEDGEDKLISPMQARKQVYIPEYAKLVSQTLLYKLLKSYADAGNKIAIVGDNLLNYYNVTAKDEKYKQLKRSVKDLDQREILGIDCIKDVIDCPYIPISDGVVLKALLQGDIEVEEGSVIDMVGILA